MDRNAPRTEPNIVAVVNEGGVWRRAEVVFLEQLRLKTQPGIVFEESSLNVVDFLT